MSGDQDKFVKVAELKNEEFNICRKELDAALTSPLVGDRRLMVLSVFGLRGSRKKIMQNILLKYLSKLTTSSQLQEQSNEFEMPLMFPFNFPKHDSTVFMWKEPFIVNLPQLDQFAVFVVDFPELFLVLNSKSACLMFAFSAMLSSHTIIHFDVLKPPDINILWQVMDFSNKEGIRISNLKLLNYHNFPKEELSLFDHLWNMLPFKSTTANEGQLAMKELEEKGGWKIAALKSSCDHFSCFKAPYLGPEVDMWDFNGDINVLPDDFKTKMIDFVEATFHHSNVFFKMVNGKFAKGTELATIIKRDYDGLISKKLPIFNSDSKERSNVKNAKVSSEALDTYLSGVQELESKKNFDEALESIFDLKRKAIRHYEKNAVESLQLNKLKGNINRVERAVIEKAQSEIFKSGVPKLTCYSLLFSHLFTVLFFILNWFLGSSILVGLTVTCGVISLFLFFIAVILLLYTKRLFCLSSGGKLFRFLEGMLKLCSHPTEFFFDLLPSSLTNAVSFGSRIRTWWSSSNESQLLPST